MFTAKNKLFKQEHYLDKAKRFYTDLINLLIEDDKDKLHVFDRNGLYLATKKIGKNNPKAEQTKEDNEVRIRLSIDVFGKCPEKLAGIIITATAKLALLISKVLTAARELKNKLFHEALEKEYGSKAVIKAEVVEQPKPQIPPRPVMPPEAAAFPRLQKIKVTLGKHNNLIFEAERERNKMEIELADLKGLARLTKKGV